MLGIAPQIASGPQISPEIIEKAKRVLDAPSWEQLSSVFRSDERRNYKISVSTDALEEEDDVEKMEQTLAFGKTIVEMMQSIIPGVQANPTLAPFSKELVMTVVKRFRVARPLEEALEDGLNQMANQPPPQTPHPDLIKAQAELAKAKSDAEIAQMKSSAELQKAQIQAQLTQLDAAERQNKMRVEYMEKIGKLQADLHNSEQDRVLKAQEIQATNGLKQTEMEMKHQREMLALDLQKEDVILKRLEIALKERQLGISERETSIKEQDLSVRAEDMRAQRQGDAEQRYMDADKIRNEGKDKAKSELSAEIAEHHKKLQDGLGKVLEEIRAKVDETHKGLGHVVDHMTSPRRVVRDEKGKPVGMEVVHKSGGETPLAERLAALKAGRKVTRDPKTGKAIGIE